MPANIAQLEFILHDFESIGHIVSEALSRAQDNKRVVLVVRIYDTRGALTKHVRMMQTLRIRSEAFYRKLSPDFLQKPFWWRWSAQWRRERLAAHILDARKKLVELALYELRATVRHEGPIGIEEYPAAPFRLARHNELHELMETAGRAKNARAFIFKPNELLADRNTLVAYTF